MLQKYVLKLQKNSLKQRQIPTFKNYDIKQRGLDLCNVLFTHGVCNLIIHTYIRIFKEKRIVFASFTFLLQQNNQQKVHNENLINKSL